MLVVPDVACDGDVPLPVMEEDPPSRALMFIQAFVKAGMFWMDCSLERLPVQ